MKRKSKKWFKTNVHSGRITMKFYMGSHEYAQDAIMVNLNEPEMKTQLRHFPYMKQSEDGLRYYATLGSLIKALKAVPGKAYKKMIRDLKYFRHNNYRWQAHRGMVNYDNFDIHLDEEISVYRWIPTLRKHKGRTYNVVKRVS